MSDYNVMYYGEESGLIISAPTEEDALEQIANAGLKDRGDNIFLVEIG